MPLLFLAILIGIPVLEISVFVEVGGEIGALNTIILTILTAVAGMALLRKQGVSVLMQAQATLQKGESPINEILNGILLAIAGLFLLIPGFVTDVVGFLLFLPPLRALLALWLGKNVRLQGPGFQTSRSQYDNGRSKNTTIIDGDFEVVKEKSESDEETDVLLEKGDTPDKDSPWAKNK
ncbi:MAG: FxsA family protein [Sneathiella sp.]|nr:FxsA family protein [Sneathiella sp.]